MIEYSWNNVVWEAIKDLKRLFNYNLKCEYSNMDEVFLACEEKLSLLGAPEREIRLRLFALALYCDKSYPRALFKSAVFTRFSETLDFLHFNQIAKILLKEGNFALIIFWAVLRCSLANSLPSEVYLALEEEMKAKSLAITLSQRVGIYAIR